MSSGLEVSKHEKHALPNSMRRRHLLHGPAWACSRAVGLPAQGSLLSLQNSLKASNRKKKRTSFKRKASKRGTEVSAWGWWSREMHLPLHRLLRLTWPGLSSFFWCTSCHSPSPYPNHTGILPVPLKYTHKTSCHLRVKVFALVCGSIVPKMIKMKMRARMCLEHFKPIEKKKKDHG